MPSAAFQVATSRWRLHLVLLALATALLLFLFRRDVSDMLSIWWTSTTFGHCLFIGPVIGWLVAQRRRELVQLTPAGWWPGLLLVAGGGLAWLLGEAGSVAFARQIGLVAMLAGAVVTLLGRQVARGLAFPLGYAVFLVPFGEWLEAPLQRVTVAIILPLLDLVNIPARVDGVLIHAGRYYFEVAEACSGAKFVIAMVAFGVLVAEVCFLSWRRRALFLLACVVVPVIANGVRAFATIWVADLTSVETATGFDHIVYGWVFFGLVMAGLLGLFWRWFDREPDFPAFDPRDLQGAPAQRLDVRIAAALVVACAAAFPAWSASVGGHGAVLPARMTLPAVAGWHRIPLSQRAPWQPFYPGADDLLIGRYADGSGHVVDMAVAAYARQDEGREIVGFGRGVLREEDRWVRVTDLPAIGGGSAMRITAPGPVDRVVATWYRIGGIVTADPKRVKIETARARLLGGSPLAVAVHLSAEVQPGSDPAATIEAFLRAAGPVERLADEVTQGAR